MHRLSVRDFLVILTVAFRLRTSRRRLRYAGRPTVSWADERRRKGSTAPPERAMTNADSRSGSVGGVPRSRHRARWRGQACVSWVVVVSAATTTTGGLSSWVYSTA